MPFKHRTVVLFLVSAMAAPSPAWAFGAVGGCTDLPEYDRAMGALEGMTSACDMTVEQARRIVAAQSGSAVYQQAAPAPRVHYRHHRARTQQP